MEQFGNPYSVSTERAAILAEQTERAAFIQRTYAHLGAAVIAFVVLEGVLLTVFPAEQLLNTLRPFIGGYGWLVFLGAFMLVSWLARSWATSDTSKGLQYAGLGLYVIAEALIFLPLMAISTVVDPSIPMNAGIITAIVFAGLTALVFITGTDFSGLGKYLWLGGLAALGIIVASVVMGGFGGMGIWFSAAMILLAAGYILYDTSNIMRHYRTDQHVAASLALFASVAMLFYYVIQLLLSMRE
jgi:FtsH-binding integral membrane protein